MNEEKELRLDQIDLWGIVLHLVKEAWVIILGAIAITLIVSIGVKATYTPEYTASVTFAVSSSTDANNIYNNLDTTTELASVFEEIFKSEIMKQTVAKELGKESLDCKITTEVIEETNLFLVYVTDKNSTDAYRILQGIIKCYPQVSDNVFDNVILQVIESPEVPMAPSNMLNLRSIQKMALLIGFAGMVCLIGAIYLFRGTVMTEEGAKEQLDGRLLGCMNRETKNKTWKTKVHRMYKNIMLTNPMTSYIYTENVHKLATKLGFEMKKRDMKSLMVTSSSENEGKTTVAANLALSLASTGYKVLLVEGDLCKPAVYKMFGYQQSAVSDYVTQLENAEPLQAKQNKNVSLFLTSRNTPRSGELLASQEMKGFLKRWEKEYDFILVDSSPVSANLDAESLADLVDASIFVVRNDFMKVAWINDAIDQLSAHNAEFLGYVLNGMGKTAMNRSYGYGHSYSYGYGKKYGYGSYKRRNIEQAAKEEC